MKHLLTQLAYLLISVSTVFLFGLALLYLGIHTQ